MEVMKQTKRKAHLQGVTQKKCARVKNDKTEMYLFNVFKGE